MKETQGLDYIEGKLLISDEIYNKLLEKILSGYWPVGERLPSEKQLCEMFSASRVSVRAALQKLQANDLIVTRQGVGSVIKAPSHDFEASSFTKSNLSEESFKQFIEFRAMLEFKAVDLIVAQYDRTAIAKIKEALEAFEINAVKGPKESDEYDYLFHMTVINNCGNDFLIKTMDTFKDEFFHYVEEVHRLAPLPFSYLLTSHKAMVDALVQRRADIWKKIILEDAVLYQKYCFENNNSEYL